MIEGGIRAPIVPATATVPVASSGWYRCFIISGMAMRPMAAEQAMEEPDTAANPAEPKIEAMASPPGSPDSQMRAALNMPRVSWV